VLSHLTPGGLAAILIPWALVWWLYRSGQSHFPAYVPEPLYVDHRMPVRWHRRR
jgi:hypothetical protein